MLVGFPQGAVVRFVEGNQEEGSYGTVFEAVVNLRCAAKKARGPAGQAQLENEAAVLATIPPHTNIVHVYGLAPDPEDDEDVLVMELAEEDMFEYRRCAPTPTPLLQLSPQLDCQGSVTHSLFARLRRVRSWHEEFVDGCAAQTCALPSGMQKRYCSCR